MPTTLTDFNDTIAALCTPPGASGRAIVRLSGDRTFAIMDALFQPASPPDSPQTRRVAAGVLQLEISGATQPCPALVYYMPAPASYTRQDVAEIQLSGSPPLITALLRQLSRLGARQAQAGEFTLRAFISGRLDLAQAQAVEALIDAQNESERRTALQRLGSGLPARLMTWKQTLTESAGLLEATLDFEEEELETEIEAGLARQLSRLAEECRTLAAQAGVHTPGDGGQRVLLAGVTNAGKSSLLNALLGHPAAIVSPERSTTRDRTLHPLRLGRYLFCLEDCPGIDTIPDAASPLAAGATDLARRTYAASPFLLLVTDAQAGATPEVKDFFAALPPCRILLVFNKCDPDLPEAMKNAAGSTPPALVRTEELRQLAESTPQLQILAECRCSALHGSGLEDLQALLMQLAAGDLAGEDSASVTRREAAELAEAAERCSAAAEALAFAPELAAVELRAAYEAVSRAGGEGYAEDILCGIFSRFCIGK